MFALRPQNHAIAAFCGAKCCRCFYSIKGRRTGRGAHPPAGGKIPLLRGGRGAGQGEGRSGRRTARARSRRPTEPTAASGKRSRGAGAGGGGEHSAPARARRCRRGEGDKPRPPRKSQKFSTAIRRAAIYSYPHVVPFFCGSAVLFSAIESQKRDSIAIFYHFPPHKKLYHR